MSVETSKYQPFPSKSERLYPVKEQSQKVWLALARKAGNQDEQNECSACSPYFRVLAVATHPTDISVITSRLAHRGLPIFHAVEALEVLNVLEWRPDVMVIHVRRGRELRAYYAGLAARLHQIPIIFVLPDVRTLAVDALLRALPVSGYTEGYRDDAKLTAQIVAAYRSGF